MMDDAGVPVIDGMRIRDGWWSTSVRVRGRLEEVFVSPKGVRYVRAGEQERADLVARIESKRFVGPLVVRFRLEEGSPLARKIRRERRAAKQEGEQRDARRKARRIRRKR